MIKELHIENLAVREDTTLEFNGRDVALVGETGAGKSLVVSSLLLLRGERADYSLVRNKEKKALVSALFSLSDAFISCHKEREEYARDNTILLKRTLNPDKTSRFYINGEPVSLSERKKVTCHLVDIHSQSNRYDLLDEEKQLRYLDLYGKEKTAKAKASFQQAYLALVQSQKEKEELRASHKERDKDYLSFQVSEIEKYHLQPNEIESLNKEYDAYREKEGRRKKFEDFLSSVSSSNGSLEDRLSACISKLHPFMDTSEKESAEELSAEARKRKDRLGEFMGKRDSFEEDSIRRDEINSRLFQLKGLRRKYGKTTKDILDKLSYYKKCLSDRDNYESRLKEMDLEIERKTAFAIEKAKVLSKERKEAALKREKEIGSQRQDLGLSRGGFKAERVSHGLTAHGLENASFRVRLNKGLGYAPLKKAASGGEASRLRLALKVVLNALDPYDLVVFDEIDTGVSGKQAKRRADKIKDRSSLSQTLRISHLPQAVSSVDEAIRIEKKTSSSTTKTTAKTLSQEETIEEIARRLSGEERTDTALEQAKTLYSAYHPKKA